MKTGNKPALRPADMSREEWVSYLHSIGYPDATVEAITAAETPVTSGVTYTTALAHAAEAQAGKLIGKANRANGAYTAVWLDRATRAWLEAQAAEHNGGNLSQELRDILTRLMAQDKKATPEDQSDAA